MRTASGTIARPREILFASAAGLLLSLILTWPLAADLGGSGRTRATDADGQFSIWNIAWVARTLVVDPINLFNANIFHPHTRTLAYSEANIVPGLIGVVPYWISRNPWLTENIVLLFGFATGYLGAYLLLRHLAQDARAAAVGAILYAFCPYVFSHLSHIQLLMTGGIPLSMLMLHRIVDPLEDSGFSQKFLTSGIWLGVALAAQALACAYYGIFAALMVGFTTIVFAVTRSLWRSSAYWIAIAAGAITSLALTMPFFVPFLRVQQEMRFTRPLDDVIRFSAKPQGYLASSANAHRWLLEAIRPYGPWGEVLFPGMLVTLLGAAGIVVATRRQGRDRETALLYGSLGLLALWASFGPAAGLYRVLAYLPAFSFLRAPARLGLVVVLCFAVFATFALRAILDAVPRRRTLLASLAGVLALADLAIVPLRWYPAPQLSPAYQVLAASPRGPLAEFPFYGERIVFHLHTQYMLFSTAHWMPLINGYSDVFPDDFRAAAPILATFPSDDAFRTLGRYRARYIGVHWDMFGGEARAEEVRAQLQKYLPTLRLLAEDERLSIYEVLVYR